MYVYICIYVGVIYVCNIYVVIIYVIYMYVIYIVVIYVCKCVCRYMMYVWIGMHEYIYVCIYLKDGSEKLWIHIADVSKWVRPGSQLSLEAEVCIIYFNILFTYLEEDDNSVHAGREDQYVS